MIEPIEIAPSTLRSGALPGATARSMWSKFTAAKSGKGSDRISLSPKATPAGKALIAEPVPEPPLHKGALALVAGPLREAQAKNGAVFYGFLSIDEQHANTLHDAIEYHHRSPVFRTTMLRLQDGITDDPTTGPAHTRVKINSTGDTSYELHSGDINWDPHSAIRVVNTLHGMTQKNGLSPASALAHEGIHAIMNREDGRQVMADHLTPVAHYDDMHERAVILDEARGAQSHGEAIRTSHRGAQFPVEHVTQSSPTSLSLDAQQQLDVEARFMHEQIIAAGYGMSMLKAVDALGKAHPSGSDVAEQMNARINAMFSAQAHADKAEKLLKYFLKNEWSSLGSSTKERLANGSLPLENVMLQLQGMKQPVVPFASYEPIVAHTSPIQT